MGIKGILEAVHLDLGPVSTVQFFLPFLHLQEQVLPASAHC